MKKISLFIAICMHLFLWPCHVTAGISLQAPEKVAKGDAFIAKVASDEQHNEYVFYWRGKQYRIKSSPENGIARILLSVPLDENASQLSIGVSPLLKNGSVEQVKANIALFDKERPVQKLTVDKKYVEPPLSARLKIEEDRKKVREALGKELSASLWDVPFLKPVSGAVTSQFGMKRVFNGKPRSVHKGLDLRAAVGTPVLAVSDGVAVLADNLYYSGNTVYLNHGDGVFTAYLHLSESKVKPGQKVAKGDIVGLAGATGRVTGPHLHLSFLVQGQAADPEPFFEKEQEAR